MKIAVIALQDPNIFPAFCHLAAALAEEGAEVDFLSRSEPKDIGNLPRKMNLHRLPQARGIAARTPWIRTSNHHILGFLRQTRPDWVIAQHEFLVASLVYKWFNRNSTKVISHFMDYETGRKYISAVKLMSRLIDVHIEVCDMRMKWRSKDWPLLRAESFVIRQAPHIEQGVDGGPHKGRTKIAFTNSKYILRLNHDRLSRFLNRLCENGISIDWYLPGPDNVRATARGLFSHPLFAVRDPVEKSRLLETLSHYDVGLHWAPMAEKEHDPDYFLSAASNKIGEYIAAGLVIAHAGNPGLSYLPDNVCAVFDPTDPEAGADQLAAQLSDRATVERKRQAALRYHLDEMNFEAQAAPFIRYVIEGSTAQRT